MDNEFDDRLSRLAELNDDELNALETEMVAAFDAADSAGDITRMQQLADTLDQVRAEKANRAAGAAPEAPPEAAPAAPPVAASGESEESETPAEDEDETNGNSSDDTVEVTTPGGTEVAVEASPEDVAADSATASDESPEDDPSSTPAETDEPTDDPSAEPTEPVEPAPEESEANASTDTPTDEEGAVKVTSADVPEGNQPVAAVVSAPTYAITAGGDIPGVTAGSELSNMDSVIDAMTRKINGMRGVGGDGERVIVASLNRDLEEEYGEDRLLRRGDSEGNSMKIRKYLQQAQSIEALIAVGWCAPKTPLYDIPGIGSTDTPVADSLASFGVDRGGIIWTEPPSLAPLAALMEFGFWTNTADGGEAPVWEFVPGIPGSSTEQPAEPLKPCVLIPCGIEHSAELKAVPLCLCFDNLMTRANPELVRASTDLVMVAQARFKEQWLLAQLFGAAGIVNNPSGCTVGAPDTPLGAARDFLITLRLAAAQFRWRNRLSANQQLRLYAPAWLRDAMAADLTVQIPGDDTLGTSMAELNGYIGDANVSPVWYIDDVPNGVGTTPTAPASNFDSYCGYPATAEWLLTLPGVFTHLDGGSLDLGVVRTKEDVQKNQFCEFAETFEAVAYMGPTDPANAWGIRGSTPVTIRGGFTPAIATVPAGGVITE